MSASRWKKWLGLIDPKALKAVTSSGKIVNVANTVDRFSQSLDVFNHLRIAEYTPIVEGKPTPGYDELRDRIVPEAADGQVTLTNGEIRIETNATHPTIGMYTRKFGRYLPGLIAVAGERVRWDSPGASTVVRYGYGDTGDNRVMMEVDADGYRTAVVSGGVRWYEQERANWIDPLDGSGPSGLDIPDLSGATLRVYFGHYGGLSFHYYLAIGRRGMPGVDGDVEVFIDSSGPRDGAVTLEQPDLPVFLEVTEGVAYRGGAQFGVYGRYRPSYRITSTGRVSKSGVGTTLVPLVSLRVKDMDKWKSVPIDLANAKASSTGNGAYQVIIDGDLDVSGSPVPSGDWTSVPGIDSSKTAMEMNTTATGITGGYKADADMITGGQGNNQGSPTEDLPDIEIPRSAVVTLAVAADSGTESFRGVLKVREEH